MKYRGMEGTLLQILIKGEGDLFRDSIDVIRQKLDIHTTVYANNKVVATTVKNVDHLELIETNASKYSREYESYLTYSKCEDMFYGNIIQGTLFFESEKRISISTETIQLLTVIYYLSKLKNEHEVSSVVDKTTGLKNRDQFLKYVEKQHRAEGCVCFVKITNMANLIGSFGIDQYNSYVKRVSEIVSGPKKKVFRYSDDILVVVMDASLETAYLAIQESLERVEQKIICSAIIKKTPAVDVLSFAFEMERMKYEEWDVKIIRDIFDVESEVTSVVSEDEPN